MKHTLLKIVAGALFLLSLSAVAFDDQALEMLKSMKIDKGQVSAMLDNLVQMGRITPEQAAKAKDELNSLSDQELKKYQDVAIEKVKTGDADRIIKHDFMKSTPKLEASLVENPYPQETEAQRAPGNEKKEEAQAPVKLDFTKLGQ